MNDDRIKSEDAEKKLPKPEVYIIRNGDAVFKPGMKTWFVETRQDAQDGSISGEVKGQTGKTPDPSDIKIGMRVKYTKLGQTGDVETLPDARGNLRIRLGSIKTDVNIKDLVIAESEPQGSKEKKRAKYGSMSFGKSKTIKTEINLIGKDLDEATDLMNKYLDDAFLAGLTSVHIIHGRGEGILRKGLRAELGRNKHVKSFKSAPYNDGGEGCTIVELKGRK